MAYEGTIDLISGLRPKNGGSFPLVDAKDVRVDDDTRMSDVAGKVVDQGDGTAYSVRVISQADYEALEQAGTVDPATLYFVEEDGNGG